eukprot:100020-Prymnesium_polylepis.1
MHIQKRVDAARRHLIDDRADCIEVGLVEDAWRRVVAAPHEAKAHRAEAELLHKLELAFAVEHVGKVPRRRLLHAIAAVENAHAAVLVNK